MGYTGMQVPSTHFGATHYGSTHYGYTHYGSTHYGSTHSLWLHSLWLHSLWLYPLWLHRFPGMQVPSNLLISHVGARWVLSSCLVAWGLISSATGLVSANPNPNHNHNPNPNPNQVSDARGLSLLRLLLGLAQSGYYSGGMLLLRGFFPTREHASTLKGSAATVRP